MRKSKGNKTRETFTTLEFRVRMEQERKELLKEKETERERVPAH